MPITGYQSKLVYRKLQQKDSSTVVLRRTSTVFPNSNYYSHTVYNRLYYNPNTVLNTRSQLLEYLVPQLVCLRLYVLNFYLALERDSSRSRFTRFWSQTQLYFHHLYYYFFLSHGANRDILHVLRTSIECTYIFTVSVLFAMYSYIFNFLKQSTTTLLTFGTRVSSSLLYIRYYDISAPHSHILCYFGTFNLMSRCTQ